MVLDLQQVVAGTNYFVKVLVHSSDSVESALLLRVFKVKLNLQDLNQKIVSNYVIFQPLPFQGTDAQLAGVKDVEKDSEITFF